MLHFECLDTIERLGLGKFLFRNIRNYELIDNLFLFSTSMMFDRITTSSWKLYLHYDDWKTENKVEQVKALLVS